MSKCFFNKKNSDNSRREFSSRISANKTVRKQTKSFRLPNKREKKDNRVTNDILYKYDNKFVMNKFFSLNPFSFFLSKEQKIRFTNVNH